MSAARLVAGAQRLLVFVVLFWSGAYLLIYLYRWEWNRAIISGIFFLAAEIALATSTLLRRMRAIEGRERAPAVAGLAATPLERLWETPIDRPDPFGWLAPRGDRLGVFVPVLLGAGAVLSALAYVVERIAEATALPVADRQLARRLDALAPAPGGLLGAPPARAPTRPRTTRPARALAVLVALAAVGVVAWLGIGALLDATQTRADDPSERPATTTIELAVAQKRTSQSPVDATRALWVGCRATLGTTRVDASITGGGADRVRVVLEPGIGRLATRRLTGCLSDLRINRLMVTVVDVDYAERNPAP